MKQRLRLLGNWVGRTVVAAASTLYVIMSIGHTIRLVHYPTSYSGDFDRAMGLSTIVVVSWMIGILTYHLMFQYALRKRRRANPPIMTLQCPRCRNPFPITEIAAHVDEHIAEARALSTHNGPPITAIVRNPSDSEWRIIQEGV